jgi:hypothetical protein
MSSYYLLENQSRSHQIKFLIVVASIGWSITSRVLLKASDIVTVINVIVSITAVCVYVWARARRSDEDEAAFREELRVANEGPSQRATAAPSTFTSFSEEFKTAVSDRMVPPPPSSAGEALKDKAQEKVVEVAAEVTAKLFELPGG